MHIPRLLICCLALSSASFVTLAQVSININVPGLIQAAPPPPRYEAVPRAVQGQVWVPGRWAWDDREYAWRRGQWQPARTDYVYAPGRWVAADGGWRWSGEQWQRRSEGRGKRHDDRRERRDDDRYDGDRGDRQGSGEHCPPGQAKKGRC